MRKVLGVVWCKLREKRAQKLKLSTRLEGPPKAYCIRGVGSGGGWRGVREELREV